MTHTGLATLALVSTFAFGQPVQAQTTDRATGPPLLVVLAPAGADRDGLPVYTRHQNGAPYVALLTRGFCGRLLRLYRWEQQLRTRRDGTPIEPAYLLLSRHEGGFPRFGFWLDGVRKDDVGYVDLHEGLTLTGRFGALDQIFPHELMHVILHQLAGSQPPGTAGANQVHAIGVRTDRVTAFDEGLAEHAQVMAVDDPDALPETAALARNSAWPVIAGARLDSYRRAIEARWSLAPPFRLSFIVWYSQTEQVLRYHAVKANLFAREAPLSPRLMSGRGLYSAYLLENAMPGSPDQPFKAGPRLLASEGAVASLFARWVSTRELQRPVPAAVLERVGARPDDVGPLDHAYLKLFVVFADHRPHDLPAFVRGYSTSFPDETAAVENLLRDAGLGWPMVPPPEIWLANDRFMTGTTIFDQYRALPRVHTFDLNAASRVDLLTIDGVTPEIAAAIRKHTPYSSLADVERVTGVTSAIAERLRAMHDSMAAVREANRNANIEGLQLTRLLRPVFVRIIGWVLICALAGAWLYRRMRSLPVWRLGINGCAAALVGLLPAWVFGTVLQIGDRPVAPALLVLLPIVSFGVPAALWQFARPRGERQNLRVLAAWTLACLPGVIVVVPVL